MLSQTSLKSTSSRRHGGWTKCQALLRNIDWKKREALPYQYSPFIYLCNHRLDKPDCELSSTFFAQSPELSIVTNQPNHRQAIVSSGILHGTRSSNSINRSGRHARRQIKWPGRDSVSERFRGVAESWMSKGERLILDGIRHGFPISLRAQQLLSSQCPQDYQSCDQLVVASGSILSSFRVICCIS